MIIHSMKITMLVLECYQFLLGHYKVVYRNFSIEVFTSLFLHAFQNEPFFDIVRFDVNLRST